MVSLEWLEITPFLNNTCNYIMVQALIVVGRMIGRGLTGCCRILVKEVVIIECQGVAVGRI